MKEILSTFLSLVSSLYINTVYSPVNFDEKFSVSSTGASIAAGIKVNMTSLYVIYLELHFNGNDQQDRLRVKALAGSGSMKDGKYIDDGVKIPVNLIIDRVENAETTRLLNEDIQNEHLIGFGENSFSKRIKAITLAPGDYNIRISSLKNIPELDDVDVHLVIQDGGRK